MKRNFFDTDFAAYAGLHAQIPRVLRYVVENRDVVIQTSELNDLAHSIRTILKNPMAEAFNRLVANEQLSNFAAVYLKSTETAVPEIVASQNITLDFKQVKGGEILRALPEFNNKILVDVTQTLKTDRYTGELQINAADVFQNLFVRGHLVASYFDSETWLTPYLSEFVVRTYTMIISSIIGRQFNLTLIEQMQIMGIFALYMCQLLSPEDDDLVMPTLFNRCTFIGSREDLKNITEACRDVSATGLTLSKTCKLVADLGPEKMRKFNALVLSTMCRVGPDVLTSRIALEYPPYWVYVLLLALSGTKTPMIYHLTANKLAQEGRTKFLDQLLSNQQIFNLHRN